jgi:hypothetical protein
MTLKVLLAIRTAAIVATIVLLFVAWLVPAWNARFVVVARRVAVATGFGAQFAMTSVAVARGREPWTRFVIPIVGAILSIEALATHALPLWSFGIVGAIEASIVAWVVVSTLRDARGRDAYPEERFARAFARVADPLVARFLAVETTVMGAALRFLGGGFRQPLPAGFGFTKTASSLPLLLALPVFLIPSMVAIDIVIPQAYWPWRLFDDVVNLYATFRTRPHRIVGDTLHLAFGVFRTAEIPLAHIAAAHVTRTNFDPNAWSRAHRTDGLSFAVDGTPVVIFNLSVPLACAHRGETREIACVAVSCDDAFALARAMARPT